MSRIQELLVDLPKCPRAAVPVGIPLTVEEETPLRVDVLAHNPLERASVPDELDVGERPEVDSPFWFDPRVREVGDGERVVLAARWEGGGELGERQALEDP